MPTEESLAARALTQGSEAGEAQAAVVAVLARGSEAGGALAAAMETLAQRSDAGRTQAEEKGNLPLG